MPKRTDIHSVLIIGAGPIIIGQACEFDYSGTQACKALKEEGYRVVLVNSNPATIMTDPEFADRTYIEPITPECVEKIIVRELAEMKQMGVPVGMLERMVWVERATSPSRRATCPPELPGKLPGRTAKLAVLPRPHTSLSCSPPSAAKRRSTPPWRSTKTARSNGTAWK